MAFNDCNINSRTRHDTFLPPSCVFLLNGFPGVGKFTMAEALEAELITTGIPHRLFDNYLIIDAAEGVLLRHTSEHYALRKQFREVAFKALQTLEEEKLVIIMTASLIITPDDLELFAEYAGIAEAKGVSLVMVNILCDAKTNGARLCSEERREGAKTKLIDVGVLETIRRERMLLDREHAVNCMRGGTVFHFELDTSGLTVESAKQKIWELMYK
jgi:hypothetical protein